jgi:transglutaminase-like putative cysteine protease
MIVVDHYMLSPVITGNSGEQLNWRRPLWEEFYPRIRHESSPEAAARIVVRHLRERVTIAPDYPRQPDVQTTWHRQIMNPDDFEVIYTAALRSVGVPAQLDAGKRAEFWDGKDWQPAPRPVLETWQDFEK